MKSISFLNVIAISVFLSIPAIATIQPIRQASDGRIEVVPYSSNNVVPIYGTTFITTQIIFNRDEVIQDIQNGDLAAWTASVNKDLPYTLFIKPTIYNSDTNMTVITNQHTYYFHLTSQKEDGNSKHPTTYAVKFIYPDNQMDQLEEVIASLSNQKSSAISAFQHPGDYNWEYSFNGDSRIVPVHVFDDGKFTYFQLQENQPVPAVFAVNNPDGKESLVNYRRQDRYLVIQQISPQFTLRLGPSEVASLFNNKLIDKLRAIS